MKQILATAAAVAAHGAFAKDIKCDIEEVSLGAISHLETVPRMAAFNNTVFLATQQKIYIRRQSQNAFVRGASPDPLGVIPVVGGDNGGKVYLEKIFAVKKDKATVCDLVADATGQRCSASSPKVTALDAIYDSSKVYIAGFSSNSSPTQPKVLRYDPTATANKIKPLDNAKDTSMARALAIGSFKDKIVTLTSSGSGKMNIWTHSPDPNVKNKATKLDVGNVTLKNLVAAKDNVVVGGSSGAITFDGKTQKKSYDKEVKLMAGGGPVVFATKSATEMKLSMDSGKTWDTAVLTPKPADMVALAYDEVTKTLYVLTKSSTEYKMVMTKCGQKTSASNSVTALSGAVLLSLVVAMLY